jgi:hypothetical protein
MHRYTKRDVQGIFDTCMKEGLFPNYAHLSITAPGDGMTRYSVYNTSGLDSKCYFLGASDAWWGLARMLDAFRLGRQIQAREDEVHPDAYLKPLEKAR